MVGKFCLHVYRRLCRVDAEARALGRLGPPRLEYMTGSEEDMRFYFAEFANYPQTLSVELRNHLGEVADRFDRLMDTLPAVDPAALRSAILESRLPTDKGAIMSTTTYTELEKLDAFLGLPAGTALATIANHDRSRLAVMNERLATHGLRLDDDTAVAPACLPTWKALMQRLGISNAWWMDGKPN